MSKLAAIFALLITLCISLILPGLVQARDAQNAATNNDDWVELFNGKNLDGWTAKIVGQPLGQDLLKTFVVEDGLLRVNYANYKKFSDQFGHLFFAEPYSHYKLLIEYRFVGEQIKGGAGWAKRNSGVMLHSQDPATMSLKQNFPDSIEAQFLGGLSDGKIRPTGNICSPGTEVDYLGKRLKGHCQASFGDTLDGEQWVSIEIIVNGAESVVHLVNGKEVIRYSNLQLSKGSASAKMRRTQDGKGAPLTLRQGFIALQSESHPIDFRRVAIQNLAK
ncbi:MAG: hypothetical protein ACI8RT_000119 [Candidatus Azotimanducaceae bacterium]|jgi:hypothetical protein|tara:strand:+ start:670 stop:1497 length:828 start_codon:yes stop_codon:yes gene_type:complete